MQLSVDANGNAWVNVARGVQSEVDAFQNGTLVPTYKWPEGTIDGLPVSPQILPAPDDAMQKKERRPPRRSRCEIEGDFAWENGAFGEHRDPEMFGPLPTGAAGATVLRLPEGRPAAGHCQIEKT